MLARHLTIFLERAQNAKKKVMNADSNSNSSVNHDHIIHTCRDKSKQQIICFENNLFDCLRVIHFVRGYRKKIDIKTK